MKIRNPDGFVIFEAGNYKDKNYDISNPEEFKKLTEGMKEIPMINVHSSDHVLDPSDIPAYGKFSDLYNDGKILKAFEFEYRDDRKEYLKELDRLSVEIDGNQITRVAALKYGEEPAANTASLRRIEFSKEVTNIKNYFEEEKMPEWDKLSFEEKIKLINQFLQAMSDTEKKLAKDQLKLDLLEEKAAQKTDAEIEQEKTTAVNAEAEKVRKEFQRREECNKWIAKNDQLIPPGIKTEFSEFAKDIFVNQEDKVLEFSKEKDGKKEEIKLKAVDFLEALVKNFGTPPQGRVEFSRNATTSNTDKEKMFKEAMEFTQGLYGTGGNK